MFTSWSCKNGQRIVQKSVVLLIKPIVFLTFSLPSASLDLKVPNLWGVGGGVVVVMLGWGGGGGGETLNRVDFGDLKVANSSLIAS